MLILYPPVTKASEPPCGPALLKAALISHGVPCQVLDMNLGAQEYFLNQYFRDHPGKEHYRNLLRSPQGYSNLSRYTRSVQEISRGLSTFTEKNEIFSPANYKHPHFDPLDSQSLIDAAIDYQENLFTPYYQQALLGLLGKNEESVVGISLQFINQAIPAFALIGYLRRQYPHLKLLLGGGLVTSWVRLQGWSNPFSEWVDEIIDGPGEVKLLEYLGIQPDKEKLKAALPDYHWLGEAAYYSPGFILPLSGSQGCSWRKCKFCPELTEQNPYIHRSSTVLLNQMDQLTERYRPVLIHFTDSEISPAHLRALSGRPGDMPWYGFTKFHGELLDPSFCQALKKSGCAMLKLGLESADPEVLESIDKGIKVEQVRIILRNLKQAGIRSYIYLLFGTPKEDLRAARRTMLFIEQEAEHITFLNTAIFNMPIANNEFTVEGAFHYGLGDLSLYRGFDHPYKWNRPLIRKFLKEEFGKRPAIGKILERTPPVYTSNHAALVNILT